MSSYKEQLKVNTDKLRKVSMMNSTTEADFVLYKIFLVFKKCKRNTKCCVQNLRHKTILRQMHQVQTLPSPPNIFAFDFGSQLYGDLLKSFNVYHILSKNPRPPPQVSLIQGRR